MKQSPLTDSNRRPPPYHRSKRQPVGTHGDGFPSVQAILGLLAARTFATRCAPSVPQLFHPNRPKTPTLDAATMTPRCGLNRSGRSNTHAAVKALRSLGRLERQVLREGAREGELGGVADAMADAAHRLLALAERPRHE